MNLSALKNYKYVRKYPSRSVIARSGSTEMIVVLMGEAAVYAKRLPSEQPDSTIGPGDCFGEKTLFLDAQQPAALVAVTDVFALVFTQDSIVPFFREEPEMAFEMMKMLCAKQGMPGGKTAAAPVPVQPQKQHEPKAEKPQPDPAIPSPSSAQPAQKPQPSALSPLFPEGHGSYQLLLHNEDSVHLMDKSYTCPFCKKEFSTRKVKQSKLIPERNDRDMRTRYQGIEPLYYDVATCPNCLYSALIDQFESPDMKKPELTQELQAYKSSVVIRTGTKLDTFSVFAGYYLALLCAPKCFASHHLSTAKLLLKLGRVYQDCGDEQMELDTAKKALDAYLYLYLNGDNDQAMDQQLCVVLGELYFKQGDIKNARDYFFKAKTNRAGSQVLKTHAENRLVDIKETDKG